MTYCNFGDPAPIDPKTNPLGIFCTQAGTRIATSANPVDPSSWKRIGSYDCGGECGKSAALLVRDSGKHYMFWGIPSINVAVSEDLVHWKTTQHDWLLPKQEWGEMWIEAGAPPRMLADGNYFFTYNIA